jgi:hypothetical protein
MAANSGSEAQFGWDYGIRLDDFGQSIRQGPVTKFFRFKSMSGAFPKRSYAAIENMDPSNQKLKQTPVKAEIMPKFQMQPDVNSIQRLIAHFCDKEPAITTPSGGTNSRQWVNVPREYGDSANSTHISRLFGEWSDGDGFPALVDNMALQEIALKIEANKIVDATLAFLGCRDTYTSDATELLLGAGAYSRKPIIRGHWSESLVANTLKVKVTAGAGGGFDGTVKWTTGAYAGSTTTPIVFDKWYHLTLDDASRLGISYFEDVEFCFPSGTGTLTTNDEWSFTSARTLATPSYSTLDPLISAGLDLTIAGSSAFVRSAEIKLFRGLKVNFVDGMKYGLSVQKNGEYGATISIDRDRDNRDFLKRIISGEAFAVTAKLYGNRIESTIDEFLQISLPNCQVTDNQRDISTPNTLPEKIEAAAHRSGPTDIFTVTSVGTLTAL